MIPNPQFQEVCLVEIRLQAGDLLPFERCYRSPTTSESSSANNDHLNQLFLNISLKNYSHVCLVEDFNLKFSNWSNWTTNHGEESTESHFIETCRDCFLLQHVDRATRRRCSDEPSTLDLIFTNEEMQVSEVKHTPPLGKSDHDVLVFWISLLCGSLQTKR